MASLSDLYVIAAPLDHPEGIATGPDGASCAAERLCDAHLGQQQDPDLLRALHRGDGLRGEARHSLGHLRHHRGLRHHRTHRVIHVYSRARNEERRSASSDLSCDGRDLGSCFA